MPGLLIPCPQCGKELRLKDRRLLGRKGKCPACAHRFLLEEPEEVELELADPTHPTPSTPQAPQGTQVQTESADPTDPTGAGFLALGEDVPQIDPVVTGVSGVGRLRELKRRKARQRNVALLVGTLVTLGVAAVVLSALNWESLSNIEDLLRAPGKQVARKTANNKTGGSGTTNDNLPPGETINEPANEHAITLKLVPNGARILFHLRPAELWSDAFRHREFRACLGDLAEWSETALEDLCLFRPAEIEEVLIALIPGIPGSPPDITAVVRLKEPRERRAFLAAFQAQPAADLGESVYVGSGRSYLLHDDRTFAVVPNGLEEELVEAREAGGITAVGIEELLERTDRRRHFTVVFDPLDVEIHREALVPAVVHPLLEEILGWLGEEVEVAAWSFHLGEEFDSEWIFRNKTAAGVTVTSLERQLRERLEGLPEEIYAGVRSLRPPTVGRRKIIGRFPAMMKVYALATDFRREGRFVRLRTTLPERAAPNLAVGAMLAWDESTAAGGERTRIRPTPRKPELPVAERLKKEILIDFRRTPLEEAFIYIGEETGVRVEVDGEALKLAGYTKNMPQTFNLGTAPANQALEEILKQYDEMVLVIDEERTVMTVMTRAVARQKGLTPYDPQP